MPSMRAVLEARRKAAAVRVEELEAELDRVRVDLADAEEVLRRRAIGLEQFLEGAGRRGTVRRDGCRSAKEVGGTAPCGASSPERGRTRGPVGGLPGGDESCGEFGEDGLGARRAAVVLGWDSASASRVEGARARLKRLVERGWLVEVKPGRFTLPA
ncbi:hypothetical protein GCM10023086_74590 [Streptomyces venetus]|uniref:Uncharacterized protein n=1 Tax=Streptomyces venetus TaxID=1701086 RepID=A0ABP8HHT8_9ACTN